MDPKALHMAPKNDHMAWNSGYMEYSMGLWKQAGTELGQAQLKLELGFTSTDLYQIN